MIMMIRVKSNLRINGENLFCIVVILEALTILATSLSMSIFASALFAMEFVLVLCLWLVGGKSNYRLLPICIVILALVNVIVNALICDTFISFEYLKKWIMLCSSILFFDTSLNMNISSNTKKNIYKVFVCLATWLALCYYFLPNIAYQSERFVDRYLTFGMTNPNLTAMFLFCLLMVVFSRMQYVEKIISKLYNLFLIITLIKIIIETQSRNVLLAIVFYLIFLVTLIKKNKKTSISKGMLLAVVFTPILFVFFYLLIYDLAIINNLLSFVVDVGKGLDSRVYVWQNGISQMIKSPLFGAYSQISAGTGVSQMHNSHLDILVSYGVIPLILTMRFLYELLLRKNEMCTTKEDKSFFFAFICVLFLGIGEAAVFSGGLGVYIFAGVPLYMINTKQH